ncbi:MAG: hypothetical protein JKY54_04635 [Flavobacteriales bacterium]|nr:hypothetical protein [Flavobacteriales bacterium]
MEKTSLVSKIKEFLTYDKVTGRFKVFEEFNKTIGLDNKEVIDGET